jgi:Flp pilus assembly protein TadD
MSDYENSIRYAPTLAEPFNGKGVLLMRLGRYDSAIVYYRKALDRKPNFPEALLNMGVSKHNLGRKAEGCEEIRRAYELGLPAAEPLLQQLCK